MMLLLLACFVLAIALSSSSSPTRLPNWSPRSTKDAFVSSSSSTTIRISASLAALIATTTTCTSNSNDKAFAADFALSSIASNLPGYGPADISYPPSFLGTWRVVQTITAIIDKKAGSGGGGGGGEGASASARTRSTLRSIDALRGKNKFEYLKRFIAAPSSSSSSSSSSSLCILDRAFSDSSYYESLLDDKFARAAWSSASDINLVSIMSSDNRVLEKRVTKRSQEQQSGGGAGAGAGGGGRGDVSKMSFKELQMLPPIANQVGYSEFFRCVESDIVGGGGGGGSSGGDGNGGRGEISPKIYACRLLARYKLDEAQGGGAGGDTDKIAGVERLYVYDGDTLDIGVVEPLVTVKSSLVLTRISSPSS